jgi:hypothetical protein
VCADGGIARVGQRAGLAVAETGDVVFIAAEVLLFRSPSDDIRLGAGLRMKFRHT